MFDDKIRYLQIALNYDMGIVACILPRVVKSERFPIETGPPFSGTNIVVVNLVRPGDPWEGIPTDADVGAMARQFLETIE
jgi:hypothetical protein